MAVMKAARALCAWGVAVLGLGAGGETLTVVSWGGAYEQASRGAVLEPFTAETGIEVAVEVYNGGLAQIRAQVETGNVYWDVVDLERADAARACDEGLLEFVDLDQLAPAPDGTSPAEDYPAEAVTECGGGLLYYSTVVAYNTEVLAGARPATIADFFDLERFPGRRGMRRSPLVNLEFALLAGGVPVSEVYGTLATVEGVARAFRKLDGIKDSIVWWEAGAQPPQMLADGEVVMSTAYNGRIFNAQVLEKQPLEILWDGQVLDSGMLGIVAGTRTGALREPAGGGGRDQSIHLVRAGAQVRRAVRLDAPGDRYRHAPASADQPGERPGGAPQRLGVVERPW